MQVKSFFWPLVLLFAFSFAAKAQTKLSYSQSQIFSAVPVVVNMGGFDTAILANVKMVRSKHGSLIDQKKKEVDIWCSAKQASLQRNKKSRKSFEPTVANSFAANFTNGTPADNNMAISNNGIIISAVNSNVRMYTETGELLAFKALSTIARDAGNFSSSAYDPHTLYDPADDRFILIFLSGYSSNNTNLVIGFSQTNDPTGNWNFYKIPGNVHGDKTWSDYPFLGISNDEVFIPVLLWKNGESGWDSEAQEIIWQIDKKKGYLGEKLEYKYYDKIKIGNRLVWNTRPVWGSMEPYGPNMYFLANRGIDVQNDSIFLFEISNTLASGKAELKIKIAKTDVPYGIPPSAKQPRPGDSLRTNYADIHAAFLHYGKIHFVGNTVSKSNGRAGIYYGVMSNIHSENPSVNAQIFTDDALDLNYPNLAYAGGGGIDRSFVVNCLHASATVNPGSSVFFIDRNGQFSDLKMVKEGLKFINVMSGDQERWGDYTGAQRKYNENGVTWFMGSFGNANAGMDSWIAKIENTDPQLGIFESKGFSSSLFPNPAHSYMQLSLQAAQSGEANLAIYNTQGQMVYNLGTEYFEQGTFVFTLDVSTLAQGAYFLQLSNGSYLENIAFIKN